MVTVIFSRGGQEFARLAVTDGQEPETSGDCSWLDFAFTPASVALGRPVTFAENPEEWARSLPGAYAGSGLDVSVAKAPPPTAPAGPPLPPDLAPSTANSAPDASAREALGSFRRSLKRAGTDSAAFTPLFDAPVIPAADALRARGRAAQADHEAGVYTALSLAGLPGAPPTAASAPVAPPVSPPANGHRKP